MYPQSGISHIVLLAASSLTCICMNVCILLFSKQLLQMRFRFRLTASDRHLKQAMLNHWHVLTGYLHGFEKCTLPDMGLISTSVHHWEKVGGLLHCASHDAVSNDGLY